MNKFCENQIKETHRFNWHGDPANRYKVNMEEKSV